MSNTFIYEITIAPTSVIIALVLAYLLNNTAYGKTRLHLCFFIPCISTPVTLAAVFKLLFRDKGIVNTIIQKVTGSMETIHWFTNPHLNKIPIIIFVIWVQIGFELVIYMAALQNIPRGLYEAVELDGVTPWKKFRKISFPLISPTIFYLIVVQFITISRRSI